MTNRLNQIFEPRPDWHTAQLPTFAPPHDDPATPRQSVIQALLKHATTLLEAENARYSASNLSQSSSHKFLKDIMASGTLEDKVSALTLVIQESPLHTMKAFENLLGLARKKSRNQAIMALGALKDLLGSGVVLPPERKLRAFARQPALISALQGDSADWKEGDKLPNGLKEVHLVSWAYEDWLKRTYFDLLKVLEGWCSDEVEYARNRAVTFVWELLKEKPEQEENLLRLLVNKLGDTDRKVASRASYLLLQLQVTHPLMKKIIIDAIESELLFRPGQSSHAKYYAIITLNQTVLSPKEPDVAGKLLDIYFSMFVALLKGGKHMRQVKEVIPSDKVQGGGGVPGKRAKQKAKIQETVAEQEDQFKERIIAQILTGINRAYPFADATDGVVETHLDTLFRITHSSNFNTSVQALMLIQQITSSKQNTADRYYRTLYESLLDPRLLTSSKQIMYLNLLYRSLKADINLKRVKAFIKRLLQIITMHEPPFACGVLFLVNELAKTFPSIQSMFTEPEVNEDDEEETFKDVPEEGVPLSEVKAPNRNPEEVRNAYNGRKREPEFANAEKSCIWELMPLMAHFHPSVSLFSERVLEGEKMEQKPDPTTFTLIHFLDRFIYRNARSKASGLRGSSIMQPLAGAASVDILIHDRFGGRDEEPLNSEAFWQKKRDDVKPDEVFFHKYFETAGKKKSRAEKRREKGDDDEDVDVDVEGDEGTDDEQEKEIWKALVGSRPEIEGDDGFDDDEDLDLGEFMDDDDDDDVEDGDGDVDGEDEGVVFSGFDSDAEDNLDDEPQPEADDFSDDEGGVGLDNLESEDEDAFVGSDDELPDHLPVPEDKEEEELDEKAAKKKERDEKKKKKRSLKSLPTFASAEDYARLLGGDSDEEGM
jgi:ribosome biogenesis protein MAK21